MAIHDAFAVAVQLQVAVVLIDASNVPPLAGTCCDVGESANEHDVVGVVGDELWPQPSVVRSTSKPPIEVIRIRTLLRAHSRCCTEQVCCRLSLAAQVPLHAVRMIFFGERA
jgi:hypothetical protein